MSNQSNFTILVNMKDNAVSAFRNSMKSLSSEVSGNVTRAFKNLSSVVSQSFNPASVTNFTTRINQATNATNTLAGAMAKVTAQQHQMKVGQGVAGATPMNGAYGGWQIKQGPGQGFARAPLLNNGVQGQNAGPAPTQPGAPSIISQLTEQFGRAWAVRTLVQAPQAFLNAEQTNAMRPLDNAAKAANFKGYMMDQTGGTDLGAQYFMGTRSYLRKGFADLKGGGAKSILGVDAMAKTGQLGYVANGGAIQDIQEAAGGNRSKSKELKDDLKGLLKLTAASIVAGPLMPLAGAAYMASGGAGGAFNGMEKIASMIGVGTKSINLSAPGGAMLDAVSGGASGAYGANAMQTLEALRKANPLMDRAFSHLAQTAFSRDSYGRRNNSSYETAAGIGSGYLFDEQESTSYATALNESVGAKRGNQMMNTMMKALRVGGLSGEAASGGMNALSNIFGGQGSTFSSQTSQASKGMEDILARAVTAGVDDSQMRDDVVNSLTTGANGVGGRQSDALANTILSAIKMFPNMDRKDVQAMNGAYIGLTESNKSGYFHNRAMPLITNVLKKYGISDPLLNETIASTNEFETNIEALDNRLGKKRGGQALAEIQAGRMNINMQNGTIPLNIRKKMENFGDQAGFRKVMAGLTNDEREEVNEFYQYDRQGGDFTKGQASQRLASNWGLRLGGGQTSFQGDRAGMAAKKNAIDAANKKRAALRKQTIKGPDGKDIDVDPLTVAEGAGVIHDEAWSPETGKTNQDPEQLMKRFVVGLEELDRAIEEFGERQRKRRGVVQTPTPE